MNRRNLLGIVSFVVLIGICVAGRLVDHIPNFTPLAAAALFAGVWFNRRITAALLVLAAMAASDAVIGGYEIGVMATVYVSLLLPILLRGVLTIRLTALRVAGCAVASSFVFYFTTNLAHWLFTDMYDHTWQGLLASYAGALPFFKYQLGGDLLWTAILFGGYAAVRQANSPEFRSAQREPAVMA